jgi:hypothetical protein
LLLVWLEPITSAEGETSTGHKLTVTMVELSALLTFMIARDSTTSGAAGANKYVAPLSLSDLSDTTHALHPKWTLTMPHPLTNLSSILRETAHLHALLVVYVYCIADRVFLMTVDGTIVLLLTNRCTHNLFHLIQYLILFVSVALVSSTAVLYPLHFLF